MSTANLLTSSCLVVAGLLTQSHQAVGTVLPLLACSALGAMGLPVESECADDLGFSVTHGDGICVAYTRVEEEQTTIFYKPCTSFMSTFEEDIKAQPQQYCDGDIGFKLDPWETEADVDKIIKDVLEYHGWDVDDYKNDETYKTYANKCLPGEVDVNNASVEQLAGVSFITMENAIAIKASAAETCFASVTELSTRDYTNQDTNDVFRVAMEADSARILAKQLCAGPCSCVNKVDLNNGDLDALKVPRGIGTATAEALLTSRAADGCFADFADVQKRTYKSSVDSILKTWFTTPSNAAQICIQGCSPWTHNNDVFQSLKFNVDINDRDPNPAFMAYMAGKMQEVADSTDVTTMFSLNDGNTVLLFVVETSNVGSFVISCG